MRISDDRYSRDRIRLDLALRFIRHEARTQTIRAWTGLTDDRIRKLYRSYFDQTGAAALPRPRGRSPQRASFFTRNPRLKQETALAASLCLLLGALPPRRAARAAAALSGGGPGAAGGAQGGSGAGQRLAVAGQGASDVGQEFPMGGPGIPRGLAQGVSQGIALCQAYEAYRALVPAARISFEHLVYLLTALLRGDELRLVSCGGCGALLVVERVALQEARCLYCADLVAERASTRATPRAAPGAPHAGDAPSAARAPPRTA